MILQEATDVDERKPRTLRPNGARIPTSRIHQINAEKAMQSNMMFADRL